MKFLLFKLCVLLCAIEFTIQEFTDEYAIKFEGDEQNIKRYARENGLEYIGPVGTLDYIHRFKISTSRKKRMASDDDYVQFHNKLNSDPNVKSVDRQKRLVRQKRDLIDNNKREHYPLNDPLWDQTWYLNRNGKSDFPDMNVTSAWLLGYTGKNVSITFLDDGLEYTHSDLKDNYDPEASTDINGNDRDPMPRYEPTNENKHGTRCAGEASAMANNSICSIGIAYHSKVGGIRMLDGEITDAVEAASLSFNPDHVSIYSASWGPDDNGQVVDGPGPLALAAFEKGAKKGRNGKGSIFVWASGNGGRNGDSCSCDGYTNNIYTLSISSTTEHDEKPWYLEECTSTLATTYSSGNERGDDRQVVTTDLRDKCTLRHTGTSAAAPLAAGIFALALEANPLLTWRDVLYLTALASRPKAIKSNVYFANKRGFLVSNTYGFGLMDAGRMVELAKNWKSVPEFFSCTTKDAKFKPTIETHPDGRTEATLYTDACIGTGNEVKYIEQVQIYVTITASRRGGVEVYLTSASGTRSKLLPLRPNDNNQEGFKNWPFTTVQLLGENPTGNWKLEVVPITGVTAKLEEYYLIIHGTKVEPIDYEYYLGLSFHCNPQCVSNEDPCGPTERDCKKCIHYTLLKDNNQTFSSCVTYCPKGYFTDHVKKQCIPCHQSCTECLTSPTDCISCKNNILKLDSHECVDKCPKGYYIDENNECSPCNSDCDECLVDKDNCISCKPNGNGLKLVNFNNFCLTENVRSCNTGNYKDSVSNQCRFCDVSCLECDGPTSNDCIKCPSGRSYLEGRKCVASCDNGYYLNPTYNRCFKCNPNCENCESTADKCTKCREGFKFDNNSCIMKIHYDEECHNTCYECFGNLSTQCRMCKPDLTLHITGECLRYPPAGYYLITQKNADSSNKTSFKPCSSHCKTCISENKCTSCANDFYLKDGNCLQPCGDYQYRDGNGSCVNCKSPCLKCSSESECITCKKDSYHLMSLCYDSCPEKYVGINANCEKCHPSCKTCSGVEKTACLTCNPGFKRKESLCVSECPDGTFFDEHLEKCVLCNTTACELCVLTANTCTKCTYPLVLDMKTSTCMSCCSRSIYGKPAITTSCCQCPPNNQYTGYCITSSTVNSSNASNQTNQNVIINSRKPFVLIAILAVIIIAFLGVSMYAIITICCSPSEPTVEYSPLNNADELEFTNQFNNNSFEDDDVDEDFLKKIKTSRLESKNLNIDTENERLMESRS